jgi:hypothetical protein
MYIVYAPVGGFGNHVRLLLLLSDKFKFYFNNKIIANTLEEKLKVVYKAVYPPEKSWHNWIQKEWAFRESFNKSILFDHKLIFTDDDPNTKIITLLVNPELCHRCYFKFNSYLNRDSREEFLFGQQEFNKLSLELAKQDTRYLPLQADILYNSILDKDLYYKMIDWFELEDRYNIASEIHKLWFELHCKAEREFVEYVNNIYG